MNFNDKLKLAKLKVTSARMAVLEILDGSSPLSAQDIIDRLELQKVSVDPVTVYRSLDQFVDKGLVKQVNFNEGKFRYELAGDHHHHLVCTGCDKVIPVEDCRIESGVQKQADEHGFEISHHSLEFFGKCQGCGEGGVGSREA